MQRSILGRAGSTPLVAKDERVLLPYSAAAFAGLATILVFLVTLAVVQNHFVLYDDAIYLGRPSIAGGVSLGGFVFALTSVSDLYWHPLTWLSHEIDVSLFGMNPAGHHFTSALIHATASGLLFLLLLRLGARTWASMAGALAWGLHPLRVESFAWVAERKDVLCALFFIASLLAYLHYHSSVRQTWRGYLAWTGLAFLALLSKPVAVCLVPVLFLLDHWPLRRRPFFDARSAIEKGPVILLTAVVAGLTVYGQKASGSTSYLMEVPWWIRIENAPVFYLRYLGKILWPAELSCFYAYATSPPDPLLSLLAAVVLLGITLLAVHLRQRQPWLLAGWLWFLVSLAPNIGLLQAGRQSIADRFTNLAMIGLVIGVTLSVSHWLHTRANPLQARAAGVGCAAVLALLGGLTVRQVGFWQDSVRLFEHAIKVEDGHHMRANLALALIAEGRYGDAEPHLVVAIRESPLRGDYHNNLANVLLRSGRVERAAEEASAAVRLDPKSTSSAGTMASVLLRQGNYRGAIIELNRVVELGGSPKSVAAQLSDIGASLATRGKPTEAEPFVRRALELDETLVQAWRNLALLLADQGREEEARGVVEEATRKTGRQTAYRGVVPLRIQD